MGNIIPCGGSRQSRRESVSGGMGGLLSANLSGFSSRGSSGSDINNGKNKTGSGGGKFVANTTTSSQAACPTILPPSSSSAVTATATATSTSTNSLTPQPWRRSSYVALRQLKMRRPSKCRVILAFGSTATSSSTSALEACSWACDRLGLETVRVGSNHEVMATFMTRGAHIVVMDTMKSKMLDTENLIRSIRASGAKGEYVVLIGVVHKGLLETEDNSIASLLNVGINKFIPDSSSRLVWYNELSLTLTSDVEKNLKLQSAEAIFAALDSCRDIVQISDSQDKFVYCNSASQRLLGFSADELHTRTVWDLQMPEGVSELVLTENEPISSQNSRGRDAVTQKLEQGKQWEGSLICKRKTGDSVPLESVAIPIRCLSASQPDLVVYVKQPPLMLRGVMSDNKMLTSESSDVNHPANKRSLRHMTRNQSCDVSMGLGPGETNYPQYLSTRRQSSGVKIHSLSVAEAPINKIINIIMEAQENSPLYVAQALDKVLEILQSSDSINLFSPEFERERKRRTDAVTSDLLGALLSEGPKPISSLSRNNSVASKHSLALRSSFHRRRNSTRDVLLTQQRRPSNDGINPKLSHPSSSHRPSVHGLDNTTSQLRELLEKSDCWEFDILQLERLTEKHCLIWLGMTTLLRFDVHKTLQCSEKTLQNWLTLIEANYNQTNSYHNSTHASDVLHSIAFFLESVKVKEFCDQYDDAACLIAAAIHDVNHPGRNSAYLVNSKAELAVLYNDITVLENHHASLGFKLSMSDDRVNIFKNLDRDTYKLIRQSVIDMVLATDMSKHFVHVNKFNSVFGRTVLKGEDELSQGEGMTLNLPSSETADRPSSPTMSTEEMLELPANTPENVAILKRMMIKCADVSNPARPLDLCKEWAYRIAEEYFSQTDDEKKLGLPVVMPQFDRTTCSIPKSQIGFYDFFIIDMFDMFSGFAELPVLTDIIKKNYVYWKEQNTIEEEKEMLLGNNTLDEKDEENMDS